MAIGTPISCKSSSTLLFENRLYLALHGFITLVDIGEFGFIAFALEMGNVHSYKYGNWLLEQDIPARGIGQLPLVASLVGVDNELLCPGDNDLNPNQNVIVSIPEAPTIKNQKVRAAFFLPRPRKIYHFVAGGIPPGALVGPDDHLRRVLGVPTLIMGLTVFEYPLAPCRRIALVDDTPEATELWTLP